MRKSIEREEEEKSLLLPSRRAKNNRDNATAMKQRVLQILFFIIIKNQLPLILKEENFRQPFIRRQAYPPNKTTTGRFRDIAALVRELLGSGFAGVKGLDHGESFAFYI